MPTSDAAANAALDREVTAGGSWWVGFAVNDLDATLTTTVEEAPLARVELPRTSAVWGTADGRHVHPSDDLAMGTATEDFTPTFWVFWGTETGGAPQHAGRIPDTEVITDAVVVIPAQTLTITYP